MSDSKFIIFAPFWNNFEWVKASLNHIDYWDYDELYLGNGCWDKKYPAESNDGTYEILKEYQSTRENVWIVDNIRDGEYRENQRNTCKLILELAQAKPNDWFMYSASDFYCFKNAIDVYKNLMENSSMDYPIFEIWNFFNSITHYYLHKTKSAMNLPHRIVEGAGFRDTCDITVNGKHYHQSPKTTGLKVPTIGMHYEGIHSPERLVQKYGVGDRKSPEVWNNGIKLKNRKIWTGAHPSFAISVLKDKFLYEEI